MMCSPKQQKPIFKFARSGISNFEEEPKSAGAENLYRLAVPIEHYIVRVPVSQQALIKAHRYWRIPDVTTIELEFEVPGTPISITWVIAHFRCTAHGKGSQNKTSQRLCTGECDTSSNPSIHIFGKCCTFSTTRPVVG
jgi:hypothetical protein